MVASAHAKDGNDAPAADGCHGARDGCVKVGRICGVGMSNQWSLRLYWSLQRQSRNTVWLSNVPSRELELGLEL
jgi:hypothetical protein